MNPGPSVHEPSILTIVLRDSQLPNSFSFYLTVCVSEWSNFYTLYIEGEEETEAEPDPTSRGGSRGGGALGAEAPPSYLGFTRSIC